MCHREPTPPLGKTVEHDPCRPLHLRGVNIFGIHDGQFTWGRIYLESVEEDGIDIEERVRRKAMGDPGAGDS
jgi:hypothetical protein